MDVEASQATEALPSDPETMVTDVHSAGSFLCSCVFPRSLQLGLETLLYSQPIPQVLQ